MTDVKSLSARIRDRVSLDWLTPSEQMVWEQLLRFNGPPHRVVNIFGLEGVGKSFLGWLLEREQLATYSMWHHPPRPVHPRIVLDNARTERQEVRGIRPLVDKLGLQQIILLSRRRVDEEFMPAFELRVTNDDIEHFAATLYRYLGVMIEESDYPNYHAALASLDRS